MFRGGLFYRNVGGTCGGGFSYYVGLIGPCSAKKKPLAELGERRNGLFFLFIFLPIQRYTMRNRKEGGERAILERWCEYAIVTTTAPLFGNPSRPPPPLSGPTSVASPAKVVPTDQNCGGGIGFSSPLFFSAKHTCVHVQVRFCSMMYFPTHENKIISI